MAPYTLQEADPQRLHIELRTIDMGKRIVNYLSQQNLNKRTVQAPPHNINPIEWQEKGEFIYLRILDNFNKTAAYMRLIFFKQRGNCWVDFLALKPPENRKIAKILWSSPFYGISYIQGAHRFFLDWNYYILKERYLQQEQFKHQDILIDFNGFEEWLILYPIYHHRESRPTPTAPSRPKNDESCQQISRFLLNLLDAQLFDLHQKLKEPMLIMETRKEIHTTKGAFTVNKKIFPLFLTILELKKEKDEKEEEKEKKSALIKAICKCLLNEGDYIIPSVTAKSARK